MRETLKYSLGILTVSLVSAALFVFVLPSDTLLHSPQISYLQSPEAGEFILVSFDRKMGENKALESFSISPAIAGELQWLKEKNELRFLPFEGFESGTSYSVSVKRPFSFLGLAQIGANTTKHTFLPKELPVGFNAKIQGKQTIYYITQSGLKRPITMDVFHSYGNKDKDLVNIDEQTLSLYPDNALIYLGHVNSPVYKLENGVKRHIQNAETFNALGFDWNSIAPVNQYELDSYPEGEPLSILSLPSRKAAEGKFVDIDLSSMKLTMWENGAIVGEMPVAGKGNPARSPTRTGLFTIKLKKNNHFSSISHVWMPWSMQYSGDYFIHGWPYWPDGSPLESKYSGGCVRLSTTDAQTLYEFADSGTYVLVR